GLAKHGRLGSTKEEIDRNLNNPENLLARCVFHCDNNVVDNQIVNMQFEDNVIAQLKTIAFTPDLGRILTIHCTDGVLYFSQDGKRSVVLEKFTGEKEIFPIEELKGAFAHHNGGDIGIIAQFIDYVEKGIIAKNITDINDSVMGHKIAFLAEESRLNSGKAYYFD
ncbi:MAG: hypothetical protein J6Q68_00620, partial [Clostridia bacterium]|nr:hypothetical protein [Clostridia bacterium]